MSAVSYFNLLYKDTYCYTRNLCNVGTFVSYRSIVVILYQTMMFSSS